MPTKETLLYCWVPISVLKVHFPKIWRMKQAVIIRINRIFHRYPIVNQVHTDGNHPRHQASQKQLRRQILPDFHRYRSTSGTRYTIFVILRQNNIPPNRQNKTASRSHSPHPDRAEAEIPFPAETAVPEARPCSCRSPESAPDG